MAWGGPSGNEIFVAVALSGDERVMTSPDGINWTFGDSLSFNGQGCPCSYFPEFRSVAWGEPVGGIFAAVDQIGLVSWSYTGLR